MTDPEPLLNATDFASFQAKDQNWFLGAVAETIVDYCGWHIFPVISETGVVAKIGNAGIIMLPTLNLVSVEAIHMNGVDLDLGVYQPNPAGFIESSVWSYNGLNFQRARGARVTVDFTHGFEVIPKAVAEVGYELTARVMEKPAGIVQDMTRGPTRLKFGEFGAVLSDDQKARLAPYTIVRV